MSGIQSRLPPIHALLAFEARARLKSGVLVARELSISPSAVSHRIRQLEHFTKLELFTKAEGETVLTPAGQSYLETVRGALHALSHFPDRAGNARRREKLRLSSPPTFALQVLTPRLGRIGEAFPLLDLAIQVSVPLIGMKAQQADVEIRFGDGRYPHREVRKLLDEKVTPVCSPDYLTRFGPFETHEDLRRARLLHCSIEPWHPWFQAAQLDWPEPSGGVEFSDVGLCVEAAAQGEGVALARPSLAASLVASGRLVPMYELSANPYYSYYTTFAAEALDRPHVMAFVDWLEADVRATTFEAAAWAPDSRHPAADAGELTLIAGSGLKRRRRA